MRIRIHKVALTAGVEKAFLMISVLSQDSDVLTFLWIDNIHKKPPEVVVFRFSHIIFGVPLSPFLLNANIKQHLEGYREAYPELVQTFLRSVYANDVSFGTEDDDSAYELYLKSKHVLAEGGFSLRKSITNSVELQQRIDESESKLASKCSTDSIHKFEEEDKTYTKSLLGGD